MEIGDRVADFEALDQNGNTVTLRGMLDDGPVVVYFYPRAMTMGCTRQSCRFRDLASEFRDLGASIVGVSADNVIRQMEFDDANSLGFPLVSDPGRAIARSFGVVRRGPLPNRRATFVIGRDGTVLKIVRSESNMRIHAETALSALRETKVDRR